MAGAGLWRLLVVLPGRRGRGRHRRRARGQAVGPRALDILVREAGGTFTSIDGAPGPHGGSAVATNGLLHELAVAQPARLSQNAVIVRNDQSALPAVKYTITLESVPTLESVRLRAPHRSEAADMTNTCRPRTAQTAPNRTGKKRRGHAEAQADGDRHRVGADHAHRRPGVPGPLQPARPAQPRPAGTASSRCSPRPARRPGSSSGSRASARRRPGSRPAAPTISTSPPTTTRR